MEEMKIQVLLQKNYSPRDTVPLRRTCLPAVLRLVVHNDRLQGLEQVQQAWILGFVCACKW
jgi:hypothetical protein